MKLVRRQFVEWLCEKPPRAYVGKPLKTNVCPLATYLYEGGVEDPFVGNFSYGSLSRDKYALPKWASNFVNQVDILPYDNVTAQRALKILGEDC